MKIPFLWLKELIDIRLSPEELANQITMSGLESSVVSGEGNSAVLEIDILPNRGDCNSVIGAAREVAAVAGGKVKLKKFKLKELSKKSAALLELDLREPKLCPKYTARVIENVAIKESPEWLKQKLALAGMRPINNVVDVTNYILLELGQPMHAFDYDKLQAFNNGLKKIIVRRASEGEKIITLDGEERTLNKEILVIADSERAIAIAGMMGGANTEVSEGTKTIVLESAYFDPVSVSKASKFTKLRTEASVRFEKTVDWEMVEYALDYAAFLISELSGGKVLASVVSQKGKFAEKRSVELRESKIEKVLGIKIPIEVALKILKGLGFTVLKNSAKTAKIGIPSYRFADVEREIDLIEEIARIYGYSQIPTTNPKISRGEVFADKNNEMSKIRDILVGLGLYEIQTFSIVDPLDVDGEKIKISNPMTVSESVMRSSLVPGVLKVISHNLRHQIDDVKVFEIGRVFSKNNPEKLVLAGGIFDAKFDFYFLKGIIESLAKEYSNYLSFEELKDDPNFNPAKSAKLVINGSVVAKFGVLHPEVAKKYDFVKDIYLFEVDIESLMRLSSDKKFVGLPKYPKIERDISMIVPQGIKYFEIIDLIKKTAGPNFEEVKLFDVYKDSQAYRISFRSKEKTLTDEEVNESFIGIIASLESNLGLKIRKS